MTPYLGHAVSVFMGFLAVMNPIANTPVFLGLTTGDSPAVRRQIAAKALLWSFAIIVLFTVAGRLIFQLFGVTLPAFRIMGGILIALVGYQMLHGGNPSSVQHPSPADQKQCLDDQLDVAISPLAMPILAGPGTIATAMNYASTGGLTEWSITLGAFCVLCLISYAFFVSGERWVRLLGPNGIKVVTRLMGLILAVIGVQMLLAGIGGAVSAYRAAGGG